jgi:hypothetical protein
VPGDRHHGFPLVLLVRTAAGDGSGRGRRSGLIPALSVK